MKRNMTISTHLLLLSNKMSQKIARITEEMIQKQYVDLSSEGYS
jgi:hypothetical protein